MNRIEVTEVAYQSVISTLPGGAERHPPVRTDDDKVWLDPTTTRRIEDVKLRGESHSDAILRLVRLDERAARLRGTSQRDKLVESAQR
jgi:hypothetical protein